MNKKKSFLYCLAEKLLFRNNKNEEINRNIRNYDPRNNNQLIINHTSGGDDKNPSILSTFSILDKANKRKNL